MPQVQVQVHKSKKTFLVSVSKLSSPLTTSWPPTDMSPWNATKCAENPLTRTFSGECNFYGTLKGIQFSIRGPFSQNLNGPGNKKPLCANRSSASAPTVNTSKKQNILFKPKSSEVSLHDGCSCDKSPSSPVSLPAVAAAAYMHPCTPWLIRLLKNQRGEKTETH